MAMTKRFGTVGIWALCLLLGATRPAFAQGQGVGSIGGVVADVSGASLPGVTVTLVNSEGTIGGNQETVSDADGAYSFLRLVPGTYTVRAQLVGFQTVEKSELRVVNDTMTRVDLPMQLGSIEETILVSASAPLLDTSNASQTRVVSQQEMQYLPNRTDVVSMARLIPAIVTRSIDVGGTGQMDLDRAAVHGSSADNKWLVDGMDDSSTTGNATSANFYPDPYTFEETSFVLGGSSAEFSAGGLTVNMITRTGTNRFSGSAKVNGTTPALANNQDYSDELEAQLMSTVPARVKAAYPDFVPNADITKMTDIGAWYGGPIKKDQLWFVVTGHDQRLNNKQLNAFNPDNTQVVSVNQLWNISGKVSWQMPKSAQLSYFANIQYKLNDGNGGSAFASSNARNYNFKYPTIHQARLTQPIGSNLVYDVGYNRYRSGNAFLPQASVAVGAIATYDTTTQVADVAAPTYQDWTLGRDQVKTSLSWVAGAHHVKGGYEFIRETRSTRFWSTSGMQANFANGVPVSVNTLLVPTTTHPSDTLTPPDVPWSYEYFDNIHGAYIQDKWSPLPRLVLNFGLRFETLQSWQDPSERQPNAFDSGASYPRIDAPSFNMDFSPRFNLVYDIKGDGKMAVKFSANRYNQPLSLLLLDRLNPQIVSTAIPGTTALAISDTRQWLSQAQCGNAGVLGCDRNGDLIPQHSELGPSPGYTYPTILARYEEGLKRPLAHEYMLEFQRVMGPAVFSIDYVMRSTRRNIGQLNTAAPPATYTGPLTVTEVVSGETVEVWNRGTSAVANLFFNDPDVDTDYRGMDVTFTKRLDKRWMLMGGATFGKVTSATRGGERNNPNVTNPEEFDRDVMTVDDRPWSYRASGIYLMPYDVMVSATWMLQSGPPETTTVLVTAQTIALAQGSQSVQTARTGDVRLANQGTVDLNIAKAFQAGQVRISPRLEIFNMTNRSTPTAWVSQLGPRYQIPTILQRSRLIKFELGVSF